MADHTIGALVEKVGALIPLMDMQKFKRSAIIGRIKIRLQFMIVRLQI